MGWVSCNAVAPKPRTEASLPSLGHKRKTSCRHRKPQGVRCKLRKRLTPAKLPLVLCFRRFSPNKKPYGSYNRELSGEGAVLVVRILNKSRLPNGLVTMFISGALYNSNYSALGLTGAFMRHTQAAEKGACTEGDTRPACRTIAAAGGVAGVLLNLGLPESEHIRRHNAWSLPKNNYISGAGCKYGRQAGPAGSRAHPEASVEVECDANV